MPATRTPAKRKQRFKANSEEHRPAIISAAVSIPEGLYLMALKAAKQQAEGNFSRYARMLIQKDLSSGKKDLGAA